MFVFPGLGYLSPYIRRFQKTYKTTEVINVAFDYLPVVKGKSLFLKTPYTSDTGLERFKLNLT